MPHYLCGEFEPMHDHENTVTATCLLRLTRQWFKTLAMGYVATTALAWVAFWGYTNDCFRKTRAASSLLDSIKRLKFCVNEVSVFRREAGENCALLGYYAERVVVIPYRRFVKTYLSHLQGLRIPVEFLLGFMDFRKRLSGITTTRCVIAYKITAIFCVAPFSRTLQFTAYVWTIIQSFIHSLFHPSIHPSIDTYIHKLMVFCPCVIV
jgi:hypothetical protein